MPPRARGREREERSDDLLANLRPNAPVEVIKAAKASLKEPSRPFTPTDRQLFSSAPDNGQQRLGTSHGAPSSRLFYDSTPKLPLPKLLDPFSPRQDPFGRSILDVGGGEAYGGASSSSLQRGGSSAAFATGSLAFPESPSRGLMMRANSRGPTAAETVAALKASMGAMDVAGRAVGRPPSSPPPPPPQQQQPQVFQLDPDEEPGEMLDPRRNDDLPPRPTTSRGRPSSSAASFCEQPAAGERYEGPSPSMVQGGSGAEVLDTTGNGSDGDNSEDDETYRHLYSYQPRPAEDLAQDPLRWPDPEGPPGAAGSGRSGSGGSFSAAPVSPVTIPRSRSSSSGRPPTGAPTLQRPASTSVSTPSLLDPDDPVGPWRLAVEETLGRMAASTSAFASTTGPAQRDAMTGLLGHTSTLGAHVEYMRRQPNSSRWLNVPCLAYRDAATGQPLLIREAIAEHVFRLMDSTNSELLIKGCGIVLRVVKSRQPLLQASKLLYRLSKDTANDPVFRREKLLEPLIRTVSVMVASSSSSSSGGSSGSSSMHEPLVYLNGCLKNVTNDASNQRGLVKLGALQVLASLLTQLATQVGAPGSASGRGQQRGPGSATVGTDPSSSSSSSDSLASQVAVQVTGVLRNLAVSPAHAAAFVSSGVLRALRATAAGAVVSGSSGQTGRASEEVVLNVGRILSKLSLHEECQAAIESDPEFAPLLVSLLGQYAEQRAILLRIAFVMGNLTTNSNAYRQQIADVPGSMGTILSILERYAARSSEEDEQVDEVALASLGQQQQQQGGGVIGAGGSQRADRLSRAARCDDCCVKLLRLMANLAIHPDVGPRLASQAAALSSLLSLLRNHSYVESEELVLNCVCALTNLSFYQGEDNLVLCAAPEALLRHVTPLLMCDNDEAAVEAARAYGNFSRVANAREYMQEARVLEAMLLLLDHSNLELLYSICGTLINFTVDSVRKEALVDLGGVARLLEVLERVATAAEASDLEASILLAVFKALYNVCADDAVPGEPLPPRPAVSEDELMTLEAVLEHVRGCEEYGAEEELMQLAERLAGQLLLISRKYQALNLVPI